MTGVSRKLMMSLVWWLLFLLLLVPWSAWTVESITYCLYLVLSSVIDATSLISLSHHFKMSSIYLRAGRPGARGFSQPLASRLQAAGKRTVVLASRCQSINYLLSSEHNESNKCKLRKMHSNELPVKQYAYLCWPPIMKINYQYAD